MISTGVSSVASWLASRPKGAAGIAMYAAIMGEEEIVRLVPADELGSSMVDAAENLLGILQEDCDSRRERTRYQIRWLTDNGAVLAGRAVDLRPMNQQTGELLEAEQAAAIQQNPVAVAFAEVLKHNAKTHQSGNHLQTTLLGQYQSIVRMLIEDKQFLTKELVAALKNRPAADDEPSPMEEAKALAFDRAAQTATEHLIPALVRVAEQHGERLLKPPAKVRAKPAKIGTKTNGAN